MSLPVSGPTECDEEWKEVVTIPPSFTPCLTLLYTRPHPSQCILSLFLTFVLKCKEFHKSEGSHRYVGPPILVLETSV